MELLRNSVSIMLIVSILYFNIYITKCTQPLILGHEFINKVEFAGNVDQDQAAKIRSGCSAKNTTKKKKKSHGFANVLVFYLDKENENVHQVVAVSI